MYEELIDGIKKGIEKNDSSLQGKNFEKGRIRNQEYFDLYMKKRDVEKRLMRMSIYKGEEPYYQPWVEMFSIKSSLMFDKKRFNYFDSKVEAELLDFFTPRMVQGSRIFIEYQHDKKTMKELSLGVPEPCTRLGYKLFQRGFTWFKDWYFSEGFHEGNQKLQGEKPIDEEHRRNQIKHINNQVTNFLENLKKQKDEDIEKEVIKRGEKILENIRDRTSSD